ncbi:MAG: sulfurtransferase [Leptolyngbya sp. SIO1D8]|nr:sulfurtransferase [Leptolyngbya sp. SIO1D8]
MPTPLVDIGWLQAHLHRREVVLIDCRFALSAPHQGRQAYEQGHLPGAYYLDLNQDLSSPARAHGGRHPLPDIDKLVAKLEALGITSNPATAVVAYDSTKGAFASRLWWLLRYLGHENVALLEGGFPAWQAAQFPLEQTVPSKPEPGSFIPCVQSDWVVDHDEVTQQKGIPGTLLVDARSPERFRGEQEPIDPIAGSIPGAMNIFWQSNLDAEGKFKQPPQLQQVWDVIPQAENSIFYCGSGVTACVNILAQTLLGRPMAKLYLGGWSDWCSYYSAGSSRQ